MTGFDFFLIGCTVLVILLFAWALCEMASRADDEMGDEGSYVEIRADEAQPGDIIDLEDDIYADPEDRANVFPYEMATVEMVELETAECVRIDFDATSIGFPVAHTLRKWRE